MNVDENNDRNVNILNSFYEALCMRSYPSHVTFFVEIKKSLCVSVYTLSYFRVIEQRHLRQ
jgi:hypothetical protein